MSTPYPKTHVVNTSTKDTYAALRNQSSYGKEAFAHLAEHIGIPREKADIIFDGANRHTPNDSELDSSEISEAMQLLATEEARVDNKIGKAVAQANRNEDRIPFDFVDNEAAQLLTGDKDGAMDSGEIQGMIDRGYMIVDDSNILTLTEKGQALLTFAKESEGGLGSDETAGHMRELEKQTLSTLGQTFEPRFTRWDTTSQVLIMELSGEELPTVETIRSLEDSFLIELKNGKLVATPEGREELNQLHAM